MKTINEQLLKQNDLSIDDLMNSLNLEGKSEKEINEIRLLVQDALGERISLFILENLSSSGLDDYQKLVSASEPDIDKIKELIFSGIDNFANRLRDVLSNLQEEIIKKFSK